MCSKGKLSEENGITKGMKLVNNIAALGRCFISDQFDNILKIFKNHGGILSYQIVQ